MYTWLTGGRTTYPNNTSVGTYGSRTCTFASFKSSTETSGMYGDGDCLWLYSPGDLLGSVFVMI